MSRQRAGAIVLLLWLALARAAFAQSPPAVVPQQLSASAWFVQGQSALGSPANRNFISNAGFVVTPAGVVVIDALGSPALAREMLAAIRKITPQPVTHVVLTHYHADHVYGLQEYKAAGARIVAHQRGREYLNSDTARLRLEASRKDLAPWIDAQTQLVQADEWIDGPRELVVGGVRLQVVPVGPAHTVEDVVVYLPSEKVLFAGDLVFRNRIPFVGQANSRHWIAALDQLLQFGAQVVVPGHGPASRDAKADMELTRDYLQHLRRVMGQAARNLEPFEEAYAAADWSRFEHLPLFHAANRMNAYNTYLLMEQEKD
ncbi:MBL fold metallo-hydrolase [Ramlibacter algicola]|uniref:MBL fold metallo-hydrolase n=1 Tax=Ramlibacter algicola TaxID=2795217 RepID=A0A934URH5_9BURK|nr:MBL fold metallo-hydrolase [Ramlibacter algicola]MBK0392542.1 MBL fold metallo-hydrolase [Ramlibacter algicola]